MDQLRTLMLLRIQRGRLLTSPPQLGSLLICVGCYLVLQSESWLLESLRTRDMLTMHLIMYKVLIEMNRRFSAVLMLRRRQQYSSCLTHSSRRGEML